MIELVPIEAVHASEYNPRRNDEKRLALAEMSLRKLGFLLPIYADRSGEILSGHQRHLVATGLAVEPFVNKHREENDFLLIDNAPAMAQACRDKYKDEPAVTVKEGNLWNFLPFEEDASLVLSVLSMQFMPTSYRQAMLRIICDGMIEGGALIYVEKVVSGSLDDLMVDLYYQMKRENGYTDEQIMAKRRSLENVLSPLEPAWNEAMLKQAGFRKVEMFWRCLNFCGWIAVK